MAKDTAVRAGTFVGVAYLISFAVALIHYDPLPDPGSVRISQPQVELFIVFALLPPLWFFVESVYLYGPGHGSDSDYNHAQELASKLWLACSAMAGLYWFHKIS